MPWNEVHMYLQPLQILPLTVHFFHRPVSHVFLPLYPLFLSPLSQFRYPHLNMVLLLPVSRRPVLITPGIGTPDLGTMEFFLIPLWKSPGWIQDICLIRLFGPECPGSHATDRSAPRYRQKNK